MREHRKRAVVTGGAGFIGSHLAEVLVRQDYAVTVVDDLSTGNPKNLEQLQGKVQFVKCSVTDLPSLKELFQGIDYVFHLAAIASVAKSIEDPKANLEVSVTGTLHVLLAAAHNNVKKVIFASSAAVYGDAPALPKREDMTPAPQSPYALGKLSAEHYCQVLGQLYQLPTVCLRYFNVYGPRQDPNSEYAAVIPKFINQVLTGNPPVIFGDGEQTRDFVFVKDVVSANILAAESDACGTFNISSGTSVSINELAGLIMRILGREFEPIYREARQGDITHSLADISKAKGFGYEPRYDLESGLAETLKGFKRK